MASDIALNKQQQVAVEQIYGPLLVLAGPGTGKTQLLSARIANILQKTDANAQNILCLTFTENAAQNMRERLSSMIGADAYDVHINTYHGFGSDIIRSYPEYFESINLQTGEDTRIERPIDDLQRFQIVESIVNKLQFNSPLIDARHYIKYVSSTISDLKRSLFTPESLRELADDNLQQVHKFSPKIAKHLANVVRFPSKVDKSLELFSGILKILKDSSGLAGIAYEELEKAMAKAVDIGKSSPLTNWKNSWLTRDSNNQFRLTDERQHLRLAELANVYEKYQDRLLKQQLYDYDDMILRTIDALKNKDELRFNLQEKYQFILLDEFQDTNAAQFELVIQLANNPVNEGRPNIFAVGDDDQAIYAFQGARVSNMLAFIKSFRDVTIVNLTENYRSHADIIHTAHNIAKQIESRLHHNLNGIEKTLTASSKNLSKNAVIQRREFSGEANENAWVANQIQKLIKNGLSPDEIAVLAPRHKLLENLVPFLATNNTPVSYEKRENILHTPLMRAFVIMIELIIASRDGDEVKINQLMPQVLSLDFYQISVQDIWKVNWTCRTANEKTSWVKTALDNDKLAQHVMFYIALGIKSVQEPLEYILDYLTGSAPIQLDEKTSYTSPLKGFYFADKNSSPLKYYETLTSLSTIREHIRAHQVGEDKLLKLQDFLDFVTAYESAGEPLINTHPIAQANKSVQLMTVYKAKGLEFEHVFLLSVHDDIWGKKARVNSNKISLPANLQQIRYQGSSEDELRRILFVAITRAKHGLYLTSHASKDNGKPTEAVKYFLEHEDDGTRKSTILPKAMQKVLKTAFTADEAIRNIDTMWHSRHLQLEANLKSLLKPRLDKYQMSPTHLNAFIDMEYGGPEIFLLQTLLRFPQAPGEDGEFGNAIHETLEWYQHKIIKNTPVTINKLTKEFDKRLNKRYIPKNRMDYFRKRGHQALRLYAQARKETLKSYAETEVDFRKEGVLLGKAHLSGKIDRLEIDKKSKIVNIIDFKTGKTYTKWEKSIKLLKYKQQLYFYKILIEGSHSWQNYKVASARLEFVEPDQNGKIVDPLYVNFDKKEEKELKQLIRIVWHKIQNLDLPNTSKYTQNLRGTMDFIKQLLE